MSAVTATADVKKRGMNGLGLVISLFLVMACMLYAIPALLSGNLLFGTDIITQKPAQAILYHQGEAYIFEPGSAEYDLLVDAAYETLGTENGIVEGLGWSEERFTQARTEGTSLELLYTTPVKLPGNRMDIADPTRLFFPLEVFGHRGEVIFRGGKSEYWGLPLRVKSLDLIRDAAEELLSAQ